MSIKKVELPRYVKVRRMMRNIRDVVEFAESGWESAEIEVGERRVDSVYVGVFKAIKNLGYEDVRVVKRGDHLYLVRKDS